jgi:uncharacterized protein (DUF362 family)
MAFENSRRNFLKFTLAGSAAAVAATRWGRSALAAAPARGPAATAATGRGPAPSSFNTVVKIDVTARSRVALTAGEDCANIAFTALNTFAKDIAAAIGDKRVILKPNNVDVRNPIACSDPKNLEGALEFLKSIGKIKQTIIAESGMVGPTLDGFTKLGYPAVAEKYGVKLVDLDKEDFQVLPCFDQTDLRPHPIRVSKLLLDPNTFIISAARLKTHDRVTATLSLKNIILGAPLRIGGGSDKSLMHGGGTYGINSNLATYAPFLHPHVALIDGYQGMEGNGPARGTTVEHRVCVASLDWLAADRVGLELMGIDPAKIGYLTYCSQSGLGQYNIDRIDIVGATLKDHIKQYKLPGSLDQQLQWMQLPTRG